MPEKIARVPQFSFELARQTWTGQSGSFVFSLYFFRIFSDFPGQTLDLNAQATILLPLVICQALKILFRKPICVLASKVYWSDRVCGGKQEQ